MQRYTFLFNNSASYLLKNNNRPLKIGYLPVCTDIEYTAEKTWLLSS